MESNDIKKQVVELVKDFEIRLNDIIQHGEFIQNGQKVGKQFIMRRGWATPTGKHEFLVEIYYDSKPIKTRQEKYGIE